MATIFLSASIPLPDRSPRYYRTADVIAIRDSIRALVQVVAPAGTLVFGGHPAITPLIRLLIREMNLDVRERVILYQSLFFQADFLPEVAEFEEVRLITSVPGSLDASLAAMRERMISDHDFDAAVFIGGMEGVETEWNIFTRIHPRKLAFPIASTGGAALELFLEHSPENLQLIENLRYLSLFRKLLQT
jgi:hypothetical protein